MFNFINVYIKTLGCNINNLESEKNFFYLKYFKIVLQKNFYNSNLLLINTCVIRNNPQRKIFKELNKWQFLKKYKKIIIFLTGCFSEFNNLKQSKILKIDILFNSSCSIYLNKMILFYIKNKKKIYFIKKKINFFYKNKINNYLLIMKGCNHNCSYCIIPQIKGKEYYFDYNFLLNNIINNIKKPYYEITLLGQNVNSYYSKFINFDSLIFNISKIKNIKRINFLSSNIKDFTKNFYFLFKNIKKISNHIHLPIQSGSNFVLKKMNRKYSIEEYFFFIKKLKRIKSVTISTDIIISFPSENFFEFDKSLKIIKKILFVDIYYFLYSKKKNTISYNFKNNNKYNNFKLKLFQKSIKNNNLIFLNKKERVLVLGYIKKNIFIGKMDCFKLVFFEYFKYEIIGNFILVKIISIKNNFFLGIYDN
ncbi:MiaB/RimO family radical SAM methylthiotransferase [Candidatus Carsonella ruddii]|uniref:tRNA (N6-isopentenyl adenosine(37)-C2)-methylthiotransferase MiaB n=1 Tax=Candidatus Carsonella ruddii (Diaphorina cf. continua) TaxID=2661587 RepID=A0A7R6VZM4_CARRU|nr:MiaB/RimO family radical SAM methylthiotransferase [Candidatus Carsonella ruddii (Diaphorina cf. continua)]BCG49333.1 tRNA (N6-isopentenyl adenosine(37)-C2)-methylthiotransferase MiaB [Candidatus Carsonella ruddii (Diaphorina cf. continua)]